MLVPLRPLLEATDKYGYAQGAFNVNAVAQAKAVIEEVLAGDSRILSQPAAPFVRVWDLGASSVDIMVRVWCQAGDYWELRSWLLENIKTALDRAGIAIPYSQLDVHLIGKN